jgi:hypothetical protein
VQRREKPEVLARNDDQPRRRTLAVFARLLGVRLLGLFGGALPSTFGCGHIIGIVLWFLHHELQNKTCKP